MERTPEERERERGWEMMKERETWIERRERYTAELQRLHHWLLCCMSNWLLTPSGLKSTGAPLSRHSLTFATSPISTAWISLCSCMLKEGIKYHQGFSSEELIVVDLFEAKLSKGDIFKLFEAIPWSKVESWKKIEVRRCYASRSMWLHCFTEKLTISKNSWARLCGGKDAK